jgi:large subunit ribosomal protein L25
MMNTESLNATIREEFGKGAARKIRSAGLLPAVVYRGGNDATSITVNVVDLEAIFRRTMNRNTLIKIEMGSDDRICLVKEVVRHPVSQQIRHVDFYEVDPAQDVEVIIKVVPTGTAKGTKMGGRLQLLRRELKMICAPGDIPDLVEIDVSELDVNDIMRVSQVPAPKGCKVVYHHDFNMVTVLGKRGAVDEEAEEGEEAPAAEGTEEG